MMAVLKQPNLIDRLPPVRGRIDAGVSLSPMTWLRVGGPAEILFRPADVADLSDFLKALDPSIPVTIIGVGSNLLVRDGGIDGVVIRLGPSFAKISVDGTTLEAGAGALDVQVAQAAAMAGISGLEFLRGVPGAIGGAVAMNAGAYGADLSAALVSIDVVYRDGTVARINRDDLAMSYRHGGVPDGAIVVAVHLAGDPDDRASITARMDDIQAARELSQPIRTKTGGSTFRNPPGHKAWELIDQAGCRGLVMGDAMVSELHCNFLINRGAATAADLEALGEEVRRRVLAHSGIALEWEIKRLGHGGTP
jgi:UDP-N-acetylmuramate dehydrogenase